MSSAASSSRERSSTSRKRRDAAGQLSFWDSAAPASEPSPAPVRNKRRASTSSPAIKVLDPEVSGLVGNEILQGRLQPAVWAMALANSSGTHDEAVTHYARLRLQSLASENELRRQKQDALESRRSSGFQKLPPEPPPQARVNQRREKLVLHPFWLGSMWLAVSGACSSAVRLFLPDSTLFIAHAGIAPHIALGAALVCLAVMVHLVIPSARLLIRSLLPVGTCALAIASFSFGVLLLQRAMFMEEGNRPVATSSPAKGSPPMEAVAKQASDVVVQPVVSKTLVTAP